MSKKRTKTQRYERQLAALDLLSQLGALPSYAESKRIELKAKLTLLYEGAAKRQMRGLLTRALHETPPFERHVIDRSELVPVKPVKMILRMRKSSQRTYNAILRGQLADKYCGCKHHGPYIHTWHVPIDWKPSLKEGRAKKALQITQRKIVYAPSES